MSWLGIVGLFDASNLAIQYSDLILFHKFFQQSLILTLKF